ncbi:uncharacterized protein LOC123313121 [Coccinella septempunctata]|uniref:uncharacterized protein LOC123313121 n=1 Tax=Coccinella septempunctata TaxID=41139 RepID=UPI001D09119A|nr:uncharacterized protein LOC123313121 [Coccinella septempunctata]
MQNYSEQMEISETGATSTSGSIRKQREFTDHELRSLYNSLGIRSNDYNQIRFEAIHLRSSNELTVKDVIDYFSEFNPKYVELVNDESYNIVWYDQSDAAKALFFSSQNNDGMPIRATRDLMIDNMPIPPGYWLLGKGHINLSSVLLRFSMRGDRRPRTKEVCSEYSRNNNPTVQSEPVNQKNPWGNLSKFWDEKYELSGRDQRRQNYDDPNSRVHLKARRRNYR